MSAAPHTVANPVVVRRTLETGGLNLITGASNLLADVAYFAVNPRLRH